MSELLVFDCSPACTDEGQKDSLELGVYRHHTCSDWCAFSIARWYTPYLAVASAKPMPLNISSSSACAMVCDGLRCLYSILSRCFTSLLTSSGATHRLAQQNRFAEQRANATGPVALHHQVAYTNMQVLLAEACKILHQGQIFHLPCNCTSTRGGWFHVYFNCVG